MLEGVRSRVHDLLKSGRGDRLAPVRAGKQGALRANHAPRRPLAPQAELIERRSWEQGLATPATSTSSTGERLDPAPVVIFHLDKHHPQGPRVGGILGG